MNRPLIDERGFVLGQVNVIDGLAAQLGAAVAAAGASFAAPGSAEVWTAGILAADLGVLWALSRLPAPSTDDAGDEPESIDEDPTDASGGATSPSSEGDEPTVVTLEVPADHDELTVRVRGVPHADGGQEVDR